MPQDDTPATPAGRIVGGRTGLSVSWMDVKLGFRMLGKEPLLTAVAILTLAIGIPTSLLPVHALGVFESNLPVDEGDRVVGIRNWDTEANGPHAFALHDFTV